MIRYWVICSMREIFRASYSEEKELKNLLKDMEFDSFLVSGRMRCDPMPNLLRMPMLTCADVYGQGAFTVPDLSHYRWSVITVYLMEESVNGPQALRPFRACYSASARNPLRRSRCREISAYCRFPLTNAPCPPPAFR